MKSKRTRKQSDGFPSPSPYEGVASSLEPLAYIPKPLWKGAELFKTSVTAVAFIPTHKLKFPFNVFRDDGVKIQPQLLSEAFEANRFRMLHGVEVEWTTETKSKIVPLDLRMLFKANSTKLWMSPIPFRAPIETANHPRWLLGELLEPPPVVSPSVIAIGNSMRAMNGFIAQPMIKMAIRNGPMIGSTLNIWCASDGCRALIAVHNNFPKYTYYLDGWQVPWETDPECKFSRFDGYDIDFRWRDFMATSICLGYSQIDLEMVRYPHHYPIPSRYPAGCTYGWWKDNSDGYLEWCPHRPGISTIKFNVPESDKEIRSWFSKWRQIVQIFRKLSGHHYELSDSDKNILNLLWEGLGARMWDCRNYESSGWRSPL
jgi:hypothetical protein